jgi:uncharacterized protein YkwD
MKPTQNIFLKIGGVIISLAIIVGGVYAAYRIIKKVPALGNFANQFTPGPLTGPKSSERAKNLSAEKIIYWTNYYREKDGKKDLSQNSQLTAAAQEKVNDMFTRQYFEHVSPTGESAADLVIAEGYNYRIVGENLALGDFKDEKDLVDAWMASPGHRENILKSDYQDIGVASKLSTYQGRLTWISVQEFGDLAPNCSFPDPTLKNTIDQKQAQYDSLGAKIQKLYNDGDSLIAQGNEKIKEGNLIYQRTHDRSKAQPYWDEAKRLQNQGQAKIDQANDLIKNYNQLKSEINSFIYQYNSQVNQYNQCIA